MGTAADSRGESAARLARNIACIKYTLFCFNIVAWVSANQASSESGSTIDVNVARNGSLPSV